MTNVVLETSDHGLGGEFDIAERGQFKTALRRFLRHRLAMGSLILLALIIVVAYLGPRITPKNISYADLSPTVGGPPSNNHWFGTDSIGHDVFAMIQRGTQKSVQIAVMVALISTGFGVLVGSLAGFYRGLLDSLLSRFTDLVQTLPILVLLLVLLRRLQDQRTNSLLISLIIAAVIWPSTARVVRGLVLSLREKEYVESARALGASDRRILVHHLLPNCIGPIIVSATLTVAVAILLEASLSFLGFGVSAPEVSLGRLVDLGGDASDTKPWLFYFPGLVLITICLCVNFIGDGLPRRARSSAGSDTSVSASPATDSGSVPHEPGSPALLDVRDLSVSFRTPDGIVQAVRGTDFAVQRGEVLGLVGESGSGKSVTMMAIMGLLARNGQVSGSAQLSGTELIGASKSQLRRLRGKTMAMVFQDPMSSLNPVHTVMHQIREALQVHSALSSAEQIKRTIELLDLVGIPNAAARADEYPHQFSGGMRQRVVIAMAVANNPDLLIADEPTTALDVTVQAQILDLLNRLRSELNMGIVLITHDLGVVAGMADRVAVMYAGRMMEQGEVDDVFYDSRNPYTRGLLSSLPRPDAHRRALRSIAGTPPSLIKLPTGCAFHPRCAHAQDVCRQDDPVLRFVHKTSTACHFADDLPALEAALEPHPMRRRTDG